MSDNTDFEWEEEEVESYKIAIIVAVWILGAICVLAMKKIEPKNKIYPVWVLFISLIFTVFTIYDWLS